MSNSRSIFGFHPLRELLRHRPHDVVEVQCAARPGKRRAEIEGLCKRHRVPFVAVPSASLDRRLAEEGSRRDQGLAHNGFAARVRATAGATAGGDDDFIVLVEDVQDPRNLGALLRVCEGAGVGRVLIRDRGSAPLTAAAIKTSAGAAEWLPTERVVNSVQAFDQLRDEGFWVYGAAAEGDPPWELDLTGKVVLCVGGEAGGLRRRTRESCDRLVGLPMRGRVESLNLATAAAALLYEAVRQRLRGG